eukprot:TRINITY_DN46463_c0_g1_i1.p1 TRINITY_DN46463_c0_g1~~TRINITY_DN46463_c0_g1_i1.p1  ORF type:complete len:398 (-),score=38.86 TRINITY_DN46463_c0_g1_i1:33-1226(-)
MAAIAKSSLLLQVVVLEAEAHGALVWPPSRNALDRLLPEFARGKAPRDTDSCNCGDGLHGCEEGERATGGGQSCLWFSQGCIIGCPECSTIGSHSGGGHPDTQGLCNSTMKPTLPRYAWTMNRKAVEGSVDDSYRLNPWRAPGYAPVSDACGMAGGTSRPHAGAGEAVFHDLAYAKMGDLGSKVLKKTPSGVTWKAGSAVQVKWGIRFNHGGGYQYRLCPSSSELTEECFMKTPLEFVRDRQQLQWSNGTRFAIDGTFVDSGTWPKGSTWAMNPIPRIDFDSTSSGQPASFSGCSFKHGEVTGPGCRQFDPPCPWDEGWQSVPGHPHSVDVEGACSGDWTAGLIVDQVRIPADLPAGDYVLGWRWDCEESSQVWNSCADVTIVVKPCCLEALLRKCC